MLQVRGKNGAGLLPLSEGRPYSLFMRSSRAPAVALIAVCQIASVATAEILPPVDRLAATIRIDTGGSGVIVSVGPDESYGMSCDHCAGSPGKVSGFRNHDGSRGRLVWVSRFPDSELSVFKCETRHVRGWVPLGSRPNPPYTATGYTGARDKLCRKWLTAKTTFRPSNLKIDRWELSYDRGDGFGNGDSGGPVFGRGPRVASLISHGDKDNTEVYVATPEQLSKAIAAVRPLSIKPEAPEESRESKSKWWGDEDRTQEILKLWAAIGNLKRPDPVKTPEPPPPVDISGLEDKIRNLENKLNRVLNTPIRVQILDPKTRKVLIEKSYPYGTPVRLMLPERR